MSLKFLTALYLIVQNIEFLLFLSFVNVAKQSQVKMENVSKKKKKKKKGG